MNKILEIKFGSSLYGTNTPNSDLDLKAIYLPTAREIILGNYKETINISRKKKENERNNKDDIDIEIFSLDRFLYQLIDGQVWALDFLFAPIDSYTDYTPEGIRIIEIIKQNKEKLISKNIAAFIGYAKKQAARYGIRGTRLDVLTRIKNKMESWDDYNRLSNYTDDIFSIINDCKEYVSLEKEPLLEIRSLPSNDVGGIEDFLCVNSKKISLNCTVKYMKNIINAMHKEYGDRSKRAYMAGGQDFKSLSHAVRIGSQALELLQTGKITFPRPDRELLIKIKTNGETGAMKNQEIYEIIENSMININNAVRDSNLREKPDKEWVDNFIYEVYSNIVKNNKEV